MSKATAAAAADTTATAAETNVKQILADALPPISPLLQAEIWARDGGVKFNTFEAVPKAGTPFENVLRPDFWANVSQRMRAGDKIIVLPRDGSWYAELLVWDAGQNWAHVDGGCAKRPEAGPRPAGVDEEFEIVSDPIDGICVLRRDSRQKLKGNFANREDARRWILDQQRVLRR